MNWNAVLADWTLQTFKVPVSDETEFYYEGNSQETMLVTAGDSWTWGDSLDTKFRHYEIYGSHLAQALNADWLNVGCKGWSNSYILDYVTEIARQLQTSSYKKIYIVVTLTENGRDITTPANFPYDYSTMFNTLGVTEQFYTQVLADAEQHWIQQLDTIESADSRIKLVVGNNFVWHNQIGLLDSTLKLNWIECLADAQGLPRPPRTNLVTGWIIDGIDNNIHRYIPVKNKTTFKSWALPYIEQADAVNRWFDSSPMNYKKASKHPIAKGHRVWAEYILNNLND